MSTWVGDIAPGEVTSVRGIPVAYPVHTAWEIARALPMLDAIPWIDALARVQRLSTHDLQNHAQSHPFAYRSKHAAATLDRADPRAEYDGAWHADAAQLIRDRARIRKLNAAGWHVYPVTARDMRNVPELIQDLRTALRDRATTLL